MNRCLGFAILLSLLFVSHIESVGAQHESSNRFYVSPILLVGNGSLTLNHPGSKETYDLNDGVGLGLGVGYALSQFRLEIESMFQGAVEENTARRSHNRPFLAGVPLSNFADQRAMLIEARRQALLERNEGKAVEFLSAHDWRDVRMNSTRLMANGWYDVSLPLRIPLAPYIGAGVGVFHNRAKAGYGTSAVFSLTDADMMVERRRASLTIGQVFSESVTGVAYQVMAGAEILLGEPLRVSLSWRFVGMQDDSIKSEFHQVALTLRYLF